VRFLKWFFLKLMLLPSAAALAVKKIAGLPVGSPATGRLAFWK